VTSFGVEKKPGSYPREKNAFLLFYKKNIIIVPMTSGDFFNQKYPPKNSMKQKKYDGSAPGNPCCGAAAAARKLPTRKNVFL